MPKDGSVVRLDGQGKPLWLVLELTYECPLKCPWCSNPVDYARRKGEELTTAEWKRVLREGRELGALQLGFTGGEPLLRDDIEELVADATALGYYTNLITSGVGLTEARLVKLKEAGLKQIQLSLQSSAPRGGASPAPAAPPAASCPTSCSSPIWWQSCAPRCALPHPIRAASS